MAEDNCEDVNTRVTMMRGRLMPCLFKAKATVVYPHSRPKRVCGVHARQAEREMENVIWDARFDQRGTRV